MHWKLIGPARNLVRRLNKPDANCAPAHEKCRRIKDKDDVARIAKAKRVKAIHLGIKATKVKIASRGFPKRPRPAPKQPLPPRNIFTRGRLLPPSQSQDLD